MGKKGCRDTWRIRRVPGGVFRGNSRGYRAAPRWSPGLGHAAQPEASGGKIRAGHVAHSAASGREFPEGAFGDTWWLGKNPGGEASLSGTRDRWHFPKDGTAGFQRRLRKVAPGRASGT